MWVNGTRKTTLLDNTTPMKNKITVQKYRDPCKQNNNSGT
jgi:hypothetical protein